MYFFFTYAIKIFYFCEILSHQAVRIFVSSSLPWTVWIRKVVFCSQDSAYFMMLFEFGSSVDGDRLYRMISQAFDRCSIHISSIPYGNLCATQESVFSIYIGGKAGTSFPFPDHSISFPISNSGAIVSLG